MAIFVFIYKCYNIYSVQLNTVGILLLNFNFLVLSFWGKENCLQGGSDGWFSGWELGWLVGNSFLFLDRYVSLIYFLFSYCDSRGSKGEFVDTKNFCLVEVYYLVFVIKIYESFQVILDVLVLFQIYLIRFFFFKQERIRILLLERMLSVLVCRGF